MHKSIFVLFCAATALAAAPKGVAPGDWAAIRAEYENHKQAVYPEGTGYRARNLSQQWVVRFDGRGFEVTPDSASWRWGLALESYGFAGAERRVTKGKAAAAGGRFSYQWADHLTEWFVNDQRGLEHGFTLARRPEGANGSLLFRLAVRGTLEPWVRDEGRTVAFAENRVAVVNYAGLKVTDARGRELTARFVREGAGLRLEVEEKGAQYPLTVDPTAQQAYLKPAAVGATQVGDEFGASVAISGDTIVVGALGESSSSTGVNSTPNELAQYAGAAYVFTRSGGAWTQEAYLKPAAVGTTQASDNFGSSVAISGDTIVVGAQGEASSTTGVNSTPDELAPRAGAAYVFTRSGGVWTQQAYLKPAAVGTTQQDHFGSSVAINGDTIVVGAPFEDSSTEGVNSTPNESASNAGAAYVFTRSGGVWSQQAYLKQPAAVVGWGGTQHDAYFGWSVAISGDRIVVGAPYEDSPERSPSQWRPVLAPDAGAAYVFTRSSGVWSQQAYLWPWPFQSGMSTAWDKFGSSVAISGDMIVVGAPLEIRAYLGAGFPLVGSAYVFYAHSGGPPFYYWSRLRPLQGVQDYFGSSVAISGDTIVVGAMNDASSTTGIDSVPNDFARLAGAAYVFTRSEGGWIQKAYLKPAAVGTTQQDDQFGNSVAISGDTIVVGAMWEDSSTTGVNSTPNESAYNAGAAHVFLITPDTEPAPNVTAQCTITSSAVVFNRATGRFRQTVTLWNHGGALYATALALDGLPAGVALYMPSGFTSAAAPVGSPYRELGPIGVSVPPVNQPVTVSVTLEFTRTGTQPITYTPRVLGAGLR